MAYRNLKAAIVMRGIKMSTIADAICISTRALYNKIEGRSTFTWNEVRKIQSRFFPDMTKDELFTESDESA